MGGGPALSVNAKEASFIRLGGVAGLVTLALHILINYVLIEPPLKGGELKAYSGPLNATIIGHGLRYPAFFCLAFFAVGMYVLTGRGNVLASYPWRILGLLGAVAQITTGVIANTIQTMAVLSSSIPSYQPEHFGLLWHLGRILFRIEPMFTGLMFVGFSIAGWESANLPKWLAVPGLLFAIISLVVPVFIGWVITAPSGPELLLLARTLLLMIWFLSACVLMIRRASLKGSVTIGAGHE